MGAKKYSSAEKVAILLLGLGEEIAGQILSQMSEDEILKVAEATSKLTQIDQQTYTETANEFLHKLNSPAVARASRPENHVAFVQKVLKSALPPDKADRLTAELSKSYQVRITAIDAADAKTLAQIIQKEQPQTMALILSHSPPQKSAEILKLLPQDLQIDVIYRIAHLDPVDPQVIEDLDNHLRAEIRKRGGTIQTKGGLRAVAAILSSMGRDDEEKILEGVQARDQDLSGEIRKQMFVFDDLTKIRGADMQLLINSVSGQIWKIALKAAKPDLLQHVFKHMSERSAKMLRDDIESTGPTAISEVEKARKKILEVATELEKTGKIKVHRQEEVYV
jgi:flagellar motor switch protein FliG